MDNILNIALYKETLSLIINNKDTINDYLSIANDTNNGKTLTINTGAIEDLPNDQLSFVKKFLQYLNKNNMGQLCKLKTFIPESYLPVYNNIYEKLSQITSFIQTTLLDEEEVKLSFGIIPIIFSVKKEKIEAALSNITDENRDTIKENIDNFNVLKFLNDYLVLFNNISLIKLLKFYNNYNLIRLMNGGYKFSEYQELLLLLDLINNTFKNNQFIKIPKFILFANNLLIYISDSNITDIVSEYNKTILTDKQINLLNINGNLQYVLQIYNIKNISKLLLKDILEKYTIKDNTKTIVKKLSITDESLYKCIKSICDYRIVDIYNNKELNINELSEVIYNELYIIFTNLNNSILLNNILLSNIPNTECETLFFLNKLSEVKSVFELFSKQVEYLDKETLDILQLPKNTYKKTKDEITLNIVDILLNDNQLNIEYLTTIFNDYVSTILSIFNKLSETPLYKAFDIIKSHIKNDKNESFILFKNKHIFRLLEDDNPSNNDDIHDENKVEKINYVSSFAEGFNKCLEYMKNNNINDILKACENIFTQVPENDLPPGNNPPLKLELDKAAEGAKSSANTGYN